MKRYLKKIVTVLCIITFLMSSVCLEQKSASALLKATDTNYMKRLNLKWDLKKGKNLTLTAKYPGIGKQRFNVKMTTYKIENDSKNGYKKLTVAFQSIRKWNPTKKKVEKLLKTEFIKNEKDYAFVPFVQGYSVTDYYTGISLEGKNDLGVTVKEISAKEYGLKKYKGTTKGSYIRLAKKITCKFQVTYPQNYDGLCIGLLGVNSEGKYVTFVSEKYNEDDNSPIVSVRDKTIGNIDDAYFEAEKYTKIKKNVFKKDKENGTPFQYGDTSYYLNGKSNAHWLQVN